MPGRGFALLFVLVCLGAMLMGNHANAEPLMIVIACVGGWTSG